MNESRHLPRVAVFATGGTIASPSEPGRGAAPRLDARHLVSAVPALAEVAQVSAASFRQVPSPELTIPDLLELVGEIRREVATGAAGAVVTQGTDSVEETSFALDLLWDGEAPVVVTGAMRNPSLPGADGPANLLAAVRVAASPAARGLGCVAVFNDEIHAARFVQKTHTTNPATFRSRLTGPLGWVTEGRVRLAVRPVGRHHLWPRRDGVPPVALLRVGLGDDGRLVGAMPGLGFAGLVVEAMGGGHLPGTMVEPLDRVARAMPVVLASRTGGGELLTDTYEFGGSERDLLRRGLIPAGALDGLKARLLLVLLLMAGVRGDGVAEAFARVAVPGAGELRIPAPGK